jgi:hypothetical protein
MTKIKEIETAPNIKCPKCRCMVRANDGYYQKLYKVTDVNYHCTLCGKITGKQYWCKILGFDVNNIIK